MTLLWSSLPPWRLSGVAVPGLALLFLGLRGQGVRRGLLLGCVWSLGYEATFLWWTRYFGAGALVVLVLVRALAPMVACGLLARPARNSILQCLSWCSGWVCLEYVQTLGPFGTSWEEVGNALVGHPAWLQVASLVGPWGLSLLIAGAACVLAEAAAVGLRLAPRDRALGWLLLVGLVLVPGGVYGFGRWRLVHRVLRPARLTVGLVQDSMSREIRWDPRFEGMAMERLRRLTRQAAARGAKVVIWPETSIPYRGFLATPRLTRDVAWLARRLKIWLVVGSIEWAPGKHTYNTLSVIGPHGSYRDRYNKQRLVPGGEYLPMAWLLRRFRAFDRVMRYVPGHGTGLLHVDGAPVGSLICFESMDPYLVRARVAGGARWLMVATNDGSMGDSAAVTDHFDAGVMRAVETGRYLVQAANNGLSGVVDPLGRVVASSHFDRVESLVARVAPDAALTPYVRWGDWLAYLCCVLFGVAQATAATASTSTMEKSASVSAMNGGSLTS